MFKITVAFITLILIQVKADWCHVCHQQENETCLEPMSNLFSKECDEDVGLSCYTRLIDGNLVERGCIDKLDENEHFSCMIDYNCRLCNGNNCNYEIFPPNRLHCHECKQDCQRDFSQEKPSICSKYHPDDECFVADNARGCVFSSANQCSTKTCIKCDTDGCNNHIYNSSTNKFSFTNPRNLIVAMVVFIMI